MPMVTTKTDATDGFCQQKTVPPRSKWDPEKARGIPATTGDFFLCLTYVSIVFWGDITCDNLHMTGILGLNCRCLSRKEPLSMESCERTTQCPCRDYPAEEANWE